MDDAVVGLMDPAHVPFVHNHHQQLRVEEYQKSYGANNPSIIYSKGNSFEMAPASGIMNENYC